MLFDDHRQRHPAAAAQRIGQIADVVDREVVVAALLEPRRDAFALLVEHGDVVDVARTHQRVDRIGQHELLQEPVLEIVGERVDPIRFALPDAVGDRRPLAARKGVHVERRAGAEVAPRIHVDLQILRRPLRQTHVEQHGSLADLAFPVVPPVGFVGVGLFVDPDVEIGSQETLVGGLADILLQLRRRDALLARHGLVVLDPHLPHQILPVGNMARDVAARAEQHAADREPNDMAQPPHRITG